MQKGCLQLESQHPIQVTLWDGRKRKEWVGFGGWLLVNLIRRDSRQVAPYTPQICCVQSKRLWVSFFLFEIYLIVNCESYKMTFLRRAPFYSWIYFFSPLSLSFAVSSTSSGLQTANRI